MWFGNLVTMNWWDNLWLKESFATFTAAYTMSKINKDMTEPIGDIWTYFCAKKNDRGYPADQKQGTHPLASTAVDTEEAEQQYDSITYTKGSCVLK